ncbi:hypothetical protein BDY17DRAFT_321340 [Neohortaea acidophila]|uniref:RING-type domain-containing protein n=1 Tax=Neohortaea acidophila TaxID=245834 RepID=A0A6A6Q3G2_9PEZI|nr:uncharacterized protein BDY17DRAFT_321340 [Neohortaea acidophila]KAF2486559.1 hypothetical protein BDY17DRAFT_321340 [Neohortaea acidophila]
MAVPRTPENKAAVADTVPLRSCIACCMTEKESTLLRPCRACNHDYCTECVLDMFITATHDSTRMPPRCCALLPIHTIIAELSDEEAAEYRAKVEEWITPVKTYCPSPTCSAFISDRLIPCDTPAKPAPLPPSIVSILQEVLPAIAASSSARFFRGEMDISELPGFTKVVKNPIDLTMIQDNISKYHSIKEVTADMRHLVSNAVDYNGVKHPVSHAARRLYAEYTDQLSAVTDRLIKYTAKEPAPKIFACPKCHVAICPSCKQIEHAGRPCDTRAAEEEAAMLERFGYKRCPRCNAGVKKMYGCSHIQCVCGGHWCYYCQRSTSECDGGCGEYSEGDDEEEEEEESEEDDESDEEEGGMDAVTSGRDVERVEGGQPAQSGNTGNSTHPPPAAAAAAPPPPPPERFVNLDAGPQRVWAEGDYDFGSEPGDEPFAQVWSCRHYFMTCEAPPADGINRGNLDRMECNRCFERVIACKPAPLSGLPQHLLKMKKRRKAGSRPKGMLLPAESSEILNEAAAAAAGSKEALECEICHIIVCSSCRNKYDAEDDAD